MLRTSLVAAVALAAAPAAAAERAPVAPSARVPIADLDLAGQPGRDELDRRLAGAIRTVCPRPRTTDVLARFQHKRCVGDASRSAARARDTAFARAALDRLQVAATAR